MHTHFWILLCCCAVLVVAMPAKATRSAALPPPGVGLEAQQVGDSLRLFVTWQAPILGPEHFPLTGYQVRIVELWEPQDTLASSFAAVPATRDSLSIVLPVLGDSILVRALVASVDEAEDISAWLASDPFVYVRTSVRPPPPQSVNVDTSLAVVIDSLEIFGWTHAQIGAKHWRIVPTDTTRLAAKLWSNNSVVACCCQELMAQLGTHPCDYIAVQNLDPLLPEGQQWFRYVRAEALSYTGEIDSEGAFGAIVADSGIMFTQPKLDWQRRIVAALNSLAG